MSEARDAEAVDLSADEGSDEAAFEAARQEAQAGEGEAPDEGEDEGEKPAVDWQKKAMDKEGQAAKERAKRREAERQVRDLSARLERLETREKAPTQREEDDLLEAINALREDDEDPITDLAQMKRAMKAFVRQQNQDSEADQRANAERERIAGLSRFMSEAEADFAEDHPDYTDAVKHFTAARREDFEDMGYAGTDLEAELAKDFLGLVQRAAKGGRDPAEVVYNLAKKRGFQSGKAAAEAKLKEIARAADAGTGATAGRNGDGRLTADSINKLTGAAYDAAWAKLEKQMKRAS